MREADQLRRDNATSNITVASNNTRITIEKVARSQVWEIEGAIPFPTDALPLLQEASKLLARAEARIRAHAKSHVWPARDALRAADRERERRASAEEGDS